MFDLELQIRFAQAVTELTSRVEAACINVEDEDTDGEVRQWLDGDESPLDWADPAVTPDEWFFLTTLYGPWNLGRQRSLIRRDFPRFVQEASRDMKKVSEELVSDWQLFDWMKRRLCRMADVLNESGQTMNDYASSLREVERRATPENPMPALSRIIRDHRAGEAKTLSVFVRDCVKGNCFPIDSRVAKQLETYVLPRDERQLVGFCLAMGLNPRRTARIFYQAPGA